MFKKIDDKMENLTKKGEDTQWGRSNVLRDNILDSSKTHKSHQGKFRDALEPKWDKHKENHNFVYSHKTAGNKDQNLKSSQRKHRPVTFRGATDQNTNKKQSNDVFKVLKENKYPPKTLYPLTEDILQK